MAMKIGFPVSRAIHRQQPDFISSDCPLGGHHIAQGIQEKFDSVAHVRHQFRYLLSRTGLVIQKHKDSFEFGDYWLFFLPKRVL